jgi:hypothetical protein
MNNRYCPAVYGAGAVGNARQQRNSGDQEQESSED